MNTRLPDAIKLVASLPMAIIVLAPGQRIASVNQVAEQFFGQSSRRLVGKPLDEVLRFEEQRLAERIADAETPLSARESDVVVVGQGARRLDVGVAPVVDEPGWQVLTLHDSTAAETMGEAPSGPDNLVLRAPEILAHEIKNPLAGIRGAAQLLARKLGDADKALTTLIADEVDRIAKLIDEMQTLSRRTTTPLAACNLHESVRRGTAVLSAGGGTRIEEEFDPSLPPVMGNADGLVQVVINLVSNAREASRDVAYPRVIVRTRFASGLQLHTTADGRPLRLPIELRVSDNGPGIDPAMRDHIFEPFVTTKKTGQGLGLALVRKLVRDMNGRITYEREEADRDGTAGWTHFRVHLPLADETSKKRKGTAA